MPYDYKAGAERVKEILNNEIEISDSKKIPKDDSKFTFSNGYYVWVTAPQGTFHNNFYHFHLNLQNQLFSLKEPPFNSIMY